MDPGPKVHWNPLPDIHELANGVCGKFFELAENSPRTVITKKISLLAKIKKKSYYFPKNL